MITRFVIILVYSSLVLFLKHKLVAQEKEPKLNREEISVAIDSISSKLRVNYVFPDLATKMVQTLKTNLRAGIYDSIEYPKKFANRLTDDLQRVSKDKHLRVIYNPSIIARENSITEEDRTNEEAEWIKTLVENLKRDNYGFREVKILEGNVGYLDLREFVDPQYGQETLVSTMRVILNTQALIIDFRKNDGGHPGMVELLASYFFSSEPVHLANHYNRPKDQLTQSWTLPNVPGKRLPDIELYILTSSTTFSAAEAFSYFMKHLGRATIVGEQTSGGAHLTGSVIATEEFFIMIPQGRPTSAVTNANWEGIGVAPHIEVSAESALKIAHTKALGDNK
ncbi:MAG: S41 family peptidase [Bacteroidota bacterium]